MMTGPNVDHQNDKELEFYIRECSKIVRLDGTDLLTDPKQILYAIGVQCAQFKSIDTIK